jgi:predicted MFS family arabinose efflux permease
VLAIGTATTVIGAAEMVGEGLTATVADRIGLGRAAVGGLALTAIGYCSLPLVGETLPLALGALFITFLAFEFTVVTAVSLFTETLPAARATMMSGLGASGSLGRVLGALIGGPLWTVGGLAATAMVSMALTTLALLCFLASLRALRATSRRRAAEPSLSARETRV